ncbi:MAG: 8-oxoguanine DNA glycosylase [Clostridia bacterium]|nr:8-oxoguanine DNA glycosylase [Clostridia bacterium]
MEQAYILKNPNSFDLIHIFECGQCFRWNKEEDNSYTGIIKNRVINIKKDNNDYKFFSNENVDLDKCITEYFDLNTDYEKIKNKLSGIDENLKLSIEYGNGIRILKQDIWECIISFIISANNNIPRIKKIIENLAFNYGKKVSFNNKEYYLFPTPEELSKATVQDLRKLGLGFRDIRVYNSTKMILNKEIDIQKLVLEPDTNKVRNELLKLDGVGEKVADCILLFGFNRFDVFPVDVWVRRVMNDLYLHNEDENKVNKNEIRKIAKEKFLGIEGLAQQYLFYWKREQ